MIQKLLEFIGTEYYGLRPGQWLMLIGVIVMTIGIIGGIICECVRE